MIIPPLSIIKPHNSVFDGITLLEYIPILRVKALIKSDLLRTDWIPNRSGILKEYPNEKEQMKSYLKLYNHQLKSFKVKYVKPKHKWGRVLVRDALGSTAFSKETRNTLIDELYYDFDLKNCQPDIIRNICLSNDIECPRIEDYCERRELILSEISQSMNVSIKTAKKLMLRLCFFGTFEGFCKENGLKDIQEPIFIKKFVKELNSIAEATKLKNPELYNTARKLKESKNEKNFLGSFYAYYLQEQEFRIVEKIMIYLMHQTIIMNHPYIQTDEKVGIYEYDGIKLLKENVDKLGKDVVLKLINDKTFELTGFKLTWEEKEIDKKLDITKWICEVSDNNKPDNELFQLCEHLNKKFDDTGVIETIDGLLKGHFIYSKGQWYCWNGVIWEKGDKELRLAITYKVSEYWFLLIAPFEEQYPQSLIDEDGFNVNCNKITEIKTKLELFTKQHLHDNTQISKCVGQGKTLLCNDKIDFDSNPDLFGCNNGVIDLKEGVFRPCRFNDYVTWSCGYDFKPICKGIKYIEYDTNKNEEVIIELTENDDENKTLDDIKIMMEQIFPDVDVRQMMLFILSTGISGIAIEKFFVFNGKGRNGKGVIDEFMNVVLGDYFSYVSPIIVTENQSKKTSSQSNPELAKLDRKRYVVMKEPPKDQLIQNNMTKDMTGGGEIQARQNYSNNTSVRLNMTLIMECNERLNFVETPKQADAERVVDVLFGSFFTDDKTLHNPDEFIYPLNAELKTDEWKKNHKNAMLNILFLYFMIFKNEGSCIIDRYIPSSVKERTLSYLQNSYDIHNIFITIYEPFDNEGVDDNDITIAQICKKIRTSDSFKSLAKSKQKEYTADYVKTFFRTNQLYKKGYYTDNHNSDCLRNFRLKPITDDDEE